MFIFFLYNLVYKLELIKCYAMFHILKKTATVFTQPSLSLPRQIENLQNQFSDVCSLPRKEKKVRL